MNSATITGTISTANLVKAARSLEVKGNLTDDERTAKAFLYEELEARAGGIKAEDEDRFWDFYAANGRSYVAALVLTFPTLAA
jgi:hypothetical protein